MEIKRNEIIRGEVVVIDIFIFIYSDAHTSVWCILVKMTGFPSEAASKLNAIRCITPFLRLGVIDSQSAYHMTENYQSDYGYIYKTIEDYEG